MISDVKTYELTAEVQFEVGEGIDLLYWIDSDDGLKKLRMDGIYPDIKTEEQVYQHFAYNAVVNGVTSASQLEGWGDLDHADILIRVIRATDFEEV